MSFWRLLAHATARARVSHPAPTRLSGRWLHLSRVAWLSVATVGITLTTLSIPIFFAQVQQVCTGAASDNPCVHPQDLQALKQLGISPAFAATILIVPSLVVIPV